MPTLPFIFPAHPQDIHLMSLFTSPLVSRLSLKKEADQLKARLKNTEAITKAAKRKYYEKTDKLSELQYQFKAANDIQQEAYAQLQCLKKQSHEKNKHFRQHMDDLNKANELAWKGDKVALQSFCINQLMAQVEKFTDLWNSNDEFRNEYVRSNERSTLWRLRTLDGRALGPGEVPPVIPRALNGRAFVDHTMSGLTSKDRTQKEVAVGKAEKVLAEKVVEQKKFSSNTKIGKRAVDLAVGGWGRGRDERWMSKLKY
ncbi:hypothetical protein GOBAR_DD28420 [Gossypium barbadense]|nr:hypothetical protein GOBAR_DD28420 [Gossypium barbadense]